MPRMGGEELISRIRQRQVFANTPILIRAGRRSATDLSADLLSSTAAVIFKNIDIETQLGQALESTLA
jgi:CheY-like chemotaxis protein